MMMALKETWTNSWKPIDGWMEPPGLEVAGLRMTVSREGGGVFVAPLEHLGSHCVVLIPRGIPLLSPFHNDRQTEISSISQVVLKRAKMGGGGLVCISGVDGSVLPHTFPICVQTA